MNKLIEVVAYKWGRGIAWYGQRVTRRAHIYTEGKENIPNEPTIWLSWHSRNLIGLALHDQYAPRPTQAFVPPGVIGTTMKGWLEGAGFTPVLLPQDGTGNPAGALKQMARGLTDGDVVIAADGPHGPVGKVRPGALWLARRTGRPLILVGSAARPGVQLPRWDRHLVPLPGAEFAIVIGAPIRLTRETALEQPLLDSIEDQINALTQRAWDILKLKR